MTLLTMAVVAQLAATPITLEEVRAASRQNLQALKAQLDLESAGLSRAQARAAILPRVDVTAGASGAVYGPQKVLGLANEPLLIDTTTTRSSLSLGLQVSQLLYDGGRWWNQIAQAGAQEDAARGQLDEQRLAAELEAVRRFFELVRAQLSLKVLQASVDRSAAQLERAKALYEAGRAQRRDVLDAEVNLGNDHISVMRQEQGVVAAQLDLAEWIARPGGEVTAVEPEVLRPGNRPAPAPDQRSALAAARKLRPLLVALDGQRRGLRLGVDIARADYFPKVSANAGYARQSPTADPFFTDPARQNSLSIGFNATWNLFAGYGTDTAVQLARVQLRGVEHQLDQALLELEGELRRGVAALNTQVAIAEVAERNRALAEEELHVEEARYAAGAGQSLEVRNAQIKVTQAQLQQLAGRIDVEIARALLHRTVGADVEERP